MGARLAATLDADEPVYFDAAVWTACVEDPAVFTEPLPPVCEIVDDYGLAHRGEWLAPEDSISTVGISSAGAQRWPSDTTSTPTSVRAVHAGQTVRPDVALLIDAADADEPPEDALTAAGEGATGPRSTSSPI